MGYYAALGRMHARQIARGEIPGGGLRNMKRPKPEDRPKEDPHIPEGCCWLYIRTRKTPKR